LTIESFNLSEDIIPAERTAHATLTIVEVPSTKSQNIDFLVKICDILISNSQQQNHQEIVPFSSSNLTAMLQSTLKANSNVRLAFLLDEEKGGLSQRAE
jgi:hypothetical protein